MLLFSKLALPRTLLLLYLLVIESHSTCTLFLSQRIHAFHISLKKVILVFNPILNQILELFHLYFHNNFIDVRIAISLVVKSLIFPGAIA